MNNNYHYLSHIKNAVEQRIGRSMSAVEFEILLIRGQGRFWDLDQDTGGIRLHDLAEIKLTAK